VKLTLAQLRKMIMEERELLERKDRTAASTDDVSPASGKRPRLGSSKRTRSSDADPEEDRGPSDGGEQTGGGSSSDDEVDCGDDYESLDGSCVPIDESWDISESGHWTSREDAFGHSARTGHAVIYDPTVPPMQEPVVPTAHPGYNVALTLMKDRISGVQQKLSRYNLPPEVLRAATMAALDELAPVEHGGLMAESRVDLGRWNLLAGTSKAP